MWFCLLYKIYLTKYGRRRHYNQLKDIEKPHVEPYQSLHFGKPGEGIEIKIVPFLEDNYGYILIDETSDCVAFVDAADPEKFDEYMDYFNLTKVDVILTTHKHWDHAAGNYILARKFPEAKIYGSADDSPDGCTDLLEDGDKINFGKWTIEGYLTPCHTVGHMIYVIRDIEAETIAFTGDFLFMASCGMFFEGTATHMQRCFDKFLEVCPPETSLLYGHEYALDDLKFAVYVDPDNEAAHDKLAEAEKWAEEHKVWLPGTIKEELTFNPFLRANTKPILEITDKEDKIEALSVLRKWKDAKKHTKQNKKAI